jgi:hypothetical protein
MSSQTKPTTPQILTKLHCDILLYLCDFLDATSILNFSLTCKKSHQLINKNESYWKLRYYKEFTLDDDWREGYWLSEYSGQTVPKPSISTTQPKTLEQKATRDWSHIHWRKAYYRRYMLNRHLIDGVWRERYCDLPVDPVTASLCIRSTNTWATVIGETDGTHMWVIQHNLAQPELEPGQLAWCELPLPTDIIGEITSILDVDMTNRYIIIQFGIPFPVKSGRGNPSSSEHIYKRKAIIAWDIQDISRAIPLYIQPVNEVRDNTFLPYLMDFYTYWILGITEVVSESQPNDISYKFILYDLERESYYSFGSVYIDGHAYIQHATEDYAQVITLHCKLDDMEVRDEGLTMTNDKPTMLRVVWHSYTFDDEHHVSSEDYSGEITLPYYDNPMVYGQIYGPGLSLILIYDSEDPELRSGSSTEPHATLALVRVPDHTLPQNNISRRRRSRYDRAIGEVIWMQPVATVCVQPLYSQNLIVVKQDSKFDILSSTDGKVIRQLDCTAYGAFGIIIGPYYLLDHNNDQTIINIETGETFRHSNKVRSPKKCRSTTSVEGTHVTGDNGTIEDTSTAEDTDEESRLLDGTTFAMITISEANEVNDMNDFSTLEVSSNADATQEDLSPATQSVRSLAASSCWPYCNSIGKLAIDEPGHRNRFYLYRLYGF